MTTRYELDSEETKLIEDFRRRQQRAIGWRKGLQRFQERLASEIGHQHIANDGLVACQTVYRVLNDTTPDQEPNL